MNIPDDMQAGVILPTRKWGELRILRYDNARAVTVEFLNTGTVRTTRSELIRKGIVEDALHPSVFGVGFLGHGPYGSRTHRKEYQTWKGVLERSYCLKLKTSRPSYVGVTCSPQWYNFQEFAEWCQWQKGFKVSGWELDKDLVSMQVGIRQYGPETCVFIPQEMNTFLVKFSAKPTELPLGVTRDKMGKDKFRAYLTYNGVDYSFRANTIKECSDWYCKKNSECISDITERFSSQLEERAVHALEQLKQRWDA